MTPAGNGPSARGGALTGAPAFGFDGFTIPAVLDRRAEQFGPRVLMSIAGTAVTFEEMRDLSCAAANVLLNIGVQHGDTVALFMPTCPEWVYFWLGAARIGAVTAPVNPAHKGEFLSHALNLARAKVVITDDAGHRRVAEVSDGVDTLGSVLIRDGSLAATLAGTSSSPPDVAAGRPDEVGVLFFTSGTTGRSKAVATTWHYLFSIAVAMATAWELGEGDVLWSAMPLFHLSAAPLVLAPMMLGATTVLRSSFHPSQVLDDIRACGAVGFAGAGAMVSMLWNQLASLRDHDNPLRFISAAPIAEDMYRRIEQRYGVRIVTAYGMTEAFPITYKGASDEGMPGASGKVNPAFDVRVLDSCGQPLPSGKVGEIVCRARSPHVLSEGYVSASGSGTGLQIEAHPEWFHTGDLGLLDPEGNLIYADRVKDSLRRRGENVSSVEVETTVTRHPAVAEAAAVGIASDLGEDDILVVVTLVPGAALDYAELLDFCAARMPYFAVPRYLEVVDELPKNMIGRIRKDLLRSKGLGAGAWDREAHGYILSR